MAHVNRRIGKSSETANTTPNGTGGGVLDAFLHDYFQRSGNVYNAPGANPQGHTATGGVISDYASGSDVYRAHIFTSSGTFTVNEVGTIDGDNIEYLVVAGGGAGGTGYYGGGGGAGGLRTNLSGHPKAGSAYPISASPGSYTITVGGGGQLSPVITARGSNGSNSYFGPPSAPEGITSQGGGGGGSRNPSVTPGSPGG